VLTGLNGSGKTQYLEALAYRLTNTTSRENPHLNGIPLILSGDNIGPHEIAYLPSAENSFRIQATNISSLHQAKHEFLNRLAPQNIAHDIEGQILRATIERKFGINVISHPPTPEMIEKLPDDFMYMMEYNEVSAGLSHVFVGYQIRVAEMLMDHRSEQHILGELGRPPWDILNEALSAAEFGYRIVPPQNKVLKTYSPKVVPIGSDTPMDLMICLLEKRPY
jgi:hypothetical protein